MNDHLAISVKNITKTYRLYDNHADRVKETFSPFRKKYHRIFKALKNVSFDVRKGETLGIVGKNGSGKSTLLQIISGVLRPSKGLVNVRGRLAALLELGTGFNPEFTGRDNIYINASILGLSREEIDDRYEEILAFANIGNFVNQPVKTYSSGMLLRLAFSVQIQVKPDILVVDEALAVGDELFQRKCYGALAKFQRDGGTLLFVSHSGSVVQELCDRAILLDGGEVIMNSDSKIVVKEYYRFIFSPHDEIKNQRQKLLQRYREGSNGAIATRRGRENRETLELSVAASNEEGYEKGQTEDDFFSTKLSTDACITYPSQGAIIQNVAVTRLDGTPVNHLIPLKRYRFNYRVAFTNLCRNVSFSMMVKSKTGLELGGRGSGGTSGSIALINPGEIYDVAMEFSTYLQPNLYFLNCGVVGICRDQEGFLARLVDCAAIRVLDRSRYLKAGYVDFNIKANIKKVKTR